ncbi:DNA repair protein RadA [Rickettsiales endosymbiont of Peranema trichophorum]|uniref:DNA repair protein RadA n=1 Tax=Rickettsiales endosymbiont of Peranema trichophorum TaxID=2486577 RepID=UPI001022DB5D|nr:DNA repair protein RadA [Rickettsiales endosymbiont of Peranema trichophorum]RZI47541.1 DNA repair protein RadA [Rickettsiales endosymbiont of Peranema trichophorum]
MAKFRETYVCQECGAHHTKWQGRCTNCLAWNSILESAQEVQTGASNVDIIEIYDLCSKPMELIRTPTGIQELDRVLGGGIVQGSVTLLGGSPGIGKSTLLLQVVNKLSKVGCKALYISGEESIEQIKLRALRLEAIEPSVQIATSISLRAIISAIEGSSDLQLVVIDSIQTLYAEEVGSAPGTVNQVRICALELTKVAKSRGVSVIFVGHITKDGYIAGPKVLEHMVDTVLYFEGDNINDLRVVRAVKNRFGAVNEIGVFEMSESGLMEIANPSSIFLPNRQGGIAGSTIFPSIEGSRPILLEIQALVVPSFSAIPRRSTVGWDSNRLAMILAILSSSLKVNLLDKEVYLNVTGGLKVTEPGVDLAVMAALLSAASSISIDHDTIFIGEIGLSGEIRQVTLLESRLNEAYRLGFTRAVIPGSAKNNDCKIKKLPIAHIKELKQIMSVL